MSINRASQTWPASHTLSIDCEIGESGCAPVVEIGKARVLTGTMPEINSGGHTQNGEGNNYDYSNVGKVRIAATPRAV